MRYCKYLSFENGATLSRYALVEKRNGVLWAALPMQAPQEDLSARILGGLPVPTTAATSSPLRSPTSSSSRPSPPPRSSA